MFSGIKIVKNDVKIKIILIAAYLIFLYVGNIIVNNKKDFEINRILQNSTQDLISYNKTFEYYQTNISDLIYENTMQIPKLKDILTKASRMKNDNEIDKLKDKFCSLAKREFSIVDRFHLSQYQFVLPNGKIIFKIGHCDMYQNNTLKDVGSFKYVMKYKSIFRGFEKDKKSLSYRNVYPIFDKSKKLIGVLYISFPSYFLQKYLTTVGHLHSHVLIRKDLFSDEIWKEKSKKYPYVRSAEDSNYMIAITKNHPISRCVVANGKKLKYIKKDIIANIKKNKPFSLYRMVNGKITIVSFLPIRESFTHQIVAWIVSYKKDFQIESILRKAFIVKMAFAVTVAIILFFLYMIMVQKEILKQKVQEEIEKNRIKDEHLMQQSRLAQMGEMISMIAHQWRQPLSAINAASGTLNMKARLNKIDNETVIKLTNKISQYSQHLSTTIDDFRGFFKPNKEKKLTTYTELIEGVLTISEISLKSKNIKLIKKLGSDIVLNTYSNEIKQVILNLIKNAEDVLVERDIKNPTIKIVTRGRNLYVEDNAGGIDEDIMDKIFDPYFSTKTKKDGTGLGLYMSKMIIEDHCGGKLSVKNGKRGAVFIIEL